jgi:hypothetical protein
MAYSKAKLKSSGNKALLYFRLLSQIRQCLFEIDLMSLWIQDCNVLPPA